jgi:hypothetical protein
MTSNAPGLLVCPDQESDAPEVNMALVIGEREEDGEILYPTASEADQSTGKNHDKTNRYFFADQTGPAYSTPMRAVRDMRARLSSLPANQTPVPSVAARPFMAPVMPKAFVREPGPANVSTPLISTAAG